MQPVHVPQRVVSEQTIGAYHSIKVVPVASKRQAERELDEGERAPGEPTDS